MIEVTLYSRPGCHLCDEMKAVIARVSRQVPMSVEEVDISGRAALEAQYGLEIPVMLVNGKKAAKHRISDDALLKLLNARSADL